ncbi:MAG TPA: HDIG domain-containing protein [Candidatus Omnitrophota bacterium]|nr:HDIG domain-containing protein [Candidatus Omnitrophota bacterium]HSA31155.1 HDIG domain-containing protein [Candidatus Omnitrophota bacterium]
MRTMVGNMLKGQVSFKDSLIALAVIMALSLFCFSIGLTFAVPFLLLILSFHVFSVRRGNSRRFLHSGLLLAILVSMAYWLAVYHKVSPYFMPVPMITMLTMLLFNDLHLVFIMAFISSILSVLIVGGDLNMMLVFFMGSMMAAYSVKDARGRSTMLNAGLFVALTEIVAIILLKSQWIEVLSRPFLEGYIYPLAASGFLSALLTIATLKIFESLFGVLTNFSLLELSDFNQPLLKRMIVEAPGTYHHSLVVSNLSEAAADTIGANALLTRVGAYYHDIGKLEKAEYFTENQMIGWNKHDLLEPSVSRLVIVNHVKQGLEIAKKYKLNPIIADFIPQHHGTSLTHYFYQKALEEAEDPSKVKQEDFRYPGPKPQVRETAIVMLADSVEAATRSLDDPNPQKIEELVHKIINNKFIDGQLDECNLTLKEIDKIASTFTRVLSAMYHSRVKYPERNGQSGNSLKSEHDQE